jgi:hypothetical protein
VNFIRSDPEPIAIARRLDAAAIAMIVAVTIASALTFSDYGLGWDDYTHSQYGELLYSLYATGFTDRRALSFVNLYMYGGGFDLIATAASQILPLELFETRRLTGAAIGIVGLFVTWRLGRRLGGPLAGVVALALLAACPLYYGHMFMNAKDAPFAVAMVLSLYATVRAFDEFPHPTPPTVALCGLGAGLAIGTRVMGGFAVLNAALPLFLILGLRLRALGTGPALREWGGFLLPFIPAAILAYLVMGLVWPWSVVSPLNPVRAVEYFSRFFETPWRELFDGQFIKVPDMPRRYVPTLLSLNLPELLLALGSLGTIGAAIAVAQNAWRRDGNINSAAMLFAILLAAMLPVVVTVATRPAMYNGIRHFVFVVPPFAVLGGLAGSFIARRIAVHGRIAGAAAAAILIAGLASPAAEMARLHPYEYVYFNHLAGGVAGARDRYMLDYWGLSMTQASRDLRALLAARGERAPDGRTWTVAVCGPHPAAVVALGDEFSAIWDPDGADFAMQLNEFYCAELDAPLLVEVVRDGVVFARVYDIRGRRVPSLLAYPNAQSP